PLQGYCTAEKEKCQGSPRGGARMTGLDIFLILVGVTSLTERLMKIIVYLDGGKYERGRNKVRPS
ncbi:hypothetical protein, partial [Alistipes sp.]|uniref:hypothetical protein n=1 Tax=Alistipes sp. TaxID=1872444 RepID=UPI003994167F